jgi:hypothetical protein
MSEPTTQELIEWAHGQEALTRSNSGNWYADKYATIATRLELLEAENKKLREAKHVCTQCGDENVHTECLPHGFQHGRDDDPNKVILSVVVPIRVCDACGFRAMDWVGMEICDREVNRHKQALLEKEDYEQ